MDKDKEVKIIDAEIINGEIEGPDTTIVLKKPFAYEGKEYKEIELNLSKLTGKDILSVENELNTLGQIAITPEISTPFLIKLAAKACGISSDILEELPISDFMLIRGRVRNFLTNAGF